MTIDEMIAVLQAAKEGKQIQWRTRGCPAADWDDFNDFSAMNFGVFDFRVKPEPRHFWVNEHQDAQGRWFGPLCNSAKEAEAIAQHRLRIVHLVEVLDETDS